MNSYLIDSRSETNLTTLYPAAQRLARAFFQAANDGRFGPGLVIKIISGTRTYAEQTQLYAQGRTAPGPIVTHAPAGYSNHNFGIAFDVGVFQNDAYLEESPLYTSLGQLGKSLGLDWGGDWVSFSDNDHFQMKMPYSWAEARALVAAGKWAALFT